MGAHRLRVLHVSDLHVVAPAKDRHRARRGLVLGKAWDANLDESATSSRRTATSTRPSASAEGSSCPSISTWIRAIQRNHNLT